LDNDTKVKPGWLNEINRFFENYPEAGLAQAKILKMGTEQFDSAGDLVTPLGFLAERARSAKDAGQFNESDKIFALKSAGLLARREVFEELGGFDEDFEIFWEDTDIAWRCWLFGGQVLFAPAVVVWHAYGTEEKPAAIYAKNQVVYRGCRNMIASQIKNLGARKLFFILPASIFSWLILAVLFFLKLDFKKGVAVLKGLLWNLFHLSLNLKKRRIVQARRKISDQDLFQRVGTRKKISYYLGKARAYLTGRPF
jgi:GT2 family glycosyltransferase